MSTKEPFTLQSVANVLLIIVYSLCFLTMLWISQSNSISAVVMRGSSNPVDHYTVVVSNKIVATVTNPKYEEFEKALYASNMHNTAIAILFLLTTISLFISMYILNFMFVFRPKSLNPQTQGK